MLDCAHGRHHRGKHPLVKRVENLEAEIAYMKAVVIDLVQALGGTANFADCSAAIPQS